MKFNNTTNSHYNIVSGFSPNPRTDFFIYARGYQESAQILTADFLSRIHYGDQNGYPIVFLYRHSLELYLKGIIYNGAILSSYSNLEIIDSVLNNPKKNNIHNLHILADKSTKLLKKLFPEDSDIENLCKEMVSISDQFMQIDKNSYSYRYPIDNEGEFSTTPNQKVNIESIAEVMDSLLKKLDIIDWRINCNTDMLHDTLDELFNQQNS